VSAFFDFFFARPVLTAVLTFLAVYPLLSSAIVSTAAIVSALRRRRSRWYIPEPGSLERAHDRYPVISILIPAHNEELVVASAVKRALAIRWPALDIIVIDDASIDGTRAAVSEFVEAGLIRLLHKPVNEGKSMALNDATRICRGELLLVLDADGQPDPAVFEWMVPRFVDAPRVAAVTGNPRVLNTRSVLARVQAIEFSATVGIQRRGDSVWGRLMTFSGLCTLVDRNALQALDGFAPNMATEDIDLTWRLQLAGRQVVYEPAALFGMQVPETIGAWWRQRRRWVEGLAQVLRRHGPAAARPAQWRLWPLLAKASLSILWAHLLVLVAIAWIVARLTDVLRPDVGSALAMFAAIVLVAGVVQVLLGFVLDARYDRGLAGQLPWAAWYPLAYWLLAVFTVVRCTIPALLRKPRGLSTWNLERLD